jgi:hypothetical protein
MLSNVPKWYYDIWIIVLRWYYDIWIIVPI